MKIYVLVEDFGYEGLRICGATTVLREAEIWESTGNPHDYVAVETDLLPQPLGFYKTSRANLYSPELKKLGEP